MAILTFSPIWAHASHAIPQLSQHRPLIVRPHCFSFLKNSQGIAMSPASWKTFKVGKIRADKDIESLHRNAKDKQKAQEIKLGFSWRERGKKRKRQRAKA